MLPLLVRRFINGDAVVYTELRTVVGEQSAHRIVSIEGHLPKLFRFDTVIRHPQAIYSTCMLQVHKRRNEILRSRCSGHAHGLRQPYETVVADVLSDEMGKVCPAYHYQSRPVRQILMEGRHGMFERVLTRCSADVHHDTRKGIAEGHAVTFSGGMAKDGLQPFCNIYSSFMQRAYDNIIHDVNLPVVLCLDRAGLVGEDGPTHHGAFDMAYLRPIPNLTIASPMNEHELRRLMYTAQLPDKGPFVLRYPRGRGVLVDWKCPLEEIPVGKGRKLKDGKDIAVISIGPIGNKARSAIARAESESGRSIAHYDLRFLKPLDEELLHEVGRTFRHIVTIEDGTIQGGMGSAVLEFMADHEYTPTVKRIGIPDKFVQHGTVAELYQLCGMDEDSLTKELLKQCELLPDMSKIKELTN